MKTFVLALLLALFLISPVVALCDVPFCDVAMETGKLSDWITCAVFALLLGDGESDPFGNIHVVF